MRVHFPRALGPASFTTLCGQFGYKPPFFNSDKTQQTGNPESITCEKCLNIYQENEKLKIWQKNAEKSQ